MEITIHIEPIIVKNENGVVLFESALFDLSFFIGNILNRDDVKRLESNEKKYAKIAEAINEKFNLTEPDRKLTWGAASAISQAVQEHVNSLKKNGAPAESQSSGSTANPQECLSSV